MKTKFIRDVILGALLAPALAVAACKNASPSRLNDYLGDIGGKYPIQMTLVFDADKVAGEYFYNAHLKDIPLRGTFGPKDSIVLEELNAAGDTVATFRGTLVGDCEKLSGAWQKTGATEKLPFSLRMSGSHRGELDDRYEVAGGTEDTVHGNAYKFWLGVKNGDKKAVASVIAYPGDVRISGKKKRFRNAREFLAVYDAIFTAEYRQAIIKTVPHNMSADSNGIMLGRGEVWFDGRGKVISLNN